MGENEPNKAMLTALRESVAWRLETEADFKALPGLRWRLDSDGCPIAVALAGKLRRDHLYFHGPGVLGIYYERQSRRAATSARNWWKARCGGSVFDEQPGDFDGLILFQPSVISDIPGIFFRSTSRGFAQKPVLRHDEGPNARLLESPGSNHAGGS